MPMLTLPFAVPEAALTNRETARLARLTREAGGAWLRAEDGRAEGWASEDTTTAALPAADTPVFALHSDRMALHLTTGENRGFRLSEAAPDARNWSAAILWTSGDAPAQALLAMRAGRGGNPVHLSETNDRLLAFRDDDGTAAVTLPHRFAAWRLTVLACAGGVLRLSQDGCTATTAGLKLPEGPAHLLIGCRKAGSGMRKTLGAGRIAEVLFWPGLDILSDPDAAPLRDALDDFRQWET